MTDRGTGLRRLAAHPAVLALAAVVTTGALFAWLRGDRAAQEGTLRVLHFPVLELQLVLLAALGALELPALRRRAGARPGHWLLLVAIVVLGVVLTAAVAPRTHRIFYDEQIYQSIGQNLSDERRAQMCNDGIVEYGRLQCLRWEYNKQPYGYPYLLSVGYRLVGSHEWVGFAINNLCHAALLVVLFLLGAVLFASPAAGLFAAFAATTIPDQLQWSNTAAAEPAGALFAALALLLAVHYALAPTVRRLLLAVVGSAFALQFRPESVLVLVIVAGTILLLAPAELRAPRLWWGALLGLVLAAPLLGHLVAVRGESWGASGPRFSISYLGGNLASNGWYYLDNLRFPVVVTACALLGLAVRGALRARLVCLLSFGALWGVFLVFYAGSYRYGADVRYALMSFPALALLAGRGAATLAGFRFPGRAGVVGALALQLLWFLPAVRATGEEAWGARADWEIAREFARSLPANSVVLTHNPNMWLLWGRNAAQTALATTDAHWLHEVAPARYAGGIYFHFNFWCNVDDPVQQAFCQRLLAEIPQELVDERRVRTYRYAMYRVLPQAPGAAARAAETGNPATPGEAD